MPNTVVVGAQWGDEGKGKVVDFLTEKADVVVRFQGGANAGHTIVVENKKYIFHLLPSGILHPKKICVIGDGIVIDIKEFINDINLVEKDGISLKDRLFVSSRAHLVMPYHKELDRVREENRRERKIGTTGRGIGPAYADKVSRFGIRTGDLLKPKVFEEKVEMSLFEKNYLFENVYKTKKMEAKSICEEYLLLADSITPYLAETSELLNEQIRQGKSILFEGAQGTFLDIDHGTYPFVTSSNTTAGGTCSGAGVGPTQIDEVVGISKAYTTRVGSGPFPTEFDEKTGAEFREAGEEYGATTGRPRRCGWLDIVMLRKAVEVNGLSSIAITKLDILDSKEEINIAVSYTIYGKKIYRFPTTIDDLEAAKPNFEVLPGWKKSTSGCRSFEDLPNNAKKYLLRIRELTNTKIVIVSVGSKRHQTIEVNI